MCGSLAMSELPTQIRADRIDILVDLSGHTEFNRLPVFARRAAPVQISLSGLPEFHRLATMDYRITDGRTDPRPLADELHSEQLLRDARFTMVLPPVRRTGVKLARYPRAKRLRHVRQLQQSLQGERYAAAMLDADFDRGAQFPAAHHSHAQSAARGRHPRHVGTRRRAPLRASNSPRYRNDVPYGLQYRGRRYRAWIISRTTASRRPASHCTSAYRSFPCTAAMVSRAAA